ncbi:MAG: hypothetical protein IKR69_06065 [Bacteroidales bacterium]|nr:hypothetical protein [Bacteroidales bacterium]
MTEEEFNELRVLDLKEAIEEAEREGTPEMLAYARKQLADLYMENDDTEKALEQYEMALKEGADDVLENLGLCYYAAGDERKAMKTWKRGAENGDQMCILRYGLALVEAREEDEDIIRKLTGLAEKEEEAAGDASAVLYLHYIREGDEDSAEAWRERAMEMGSNLMEALEQENSEAENGEDDWS